MPDMYLRLLQSPVLILHLLQILCFEDQLSYVTECEDIEGTHALIPKLTSIAALAGPGYPAQVGLSIT